MTTLSPISDAAWQEAAEKTENWSSLPFEEHVWEAAFYQAWSDVDAVSMRNKVLMQEALQAQHTAVLECFWRRFREAEAREAATAAQTPKLTQGGEKSPSKPGWSLEKLFAVWVGIPWGILFFLSLILFSAEESSVGEDDGGFVFIISICTATVLTGCFLFVCSVASIGWHAAGAAVKVGMKATGFGESSDTKGS